MQDDQLSDPTNVEGCRLRSVAAESSSELRSDGGRWALGRKRERDEIVAEQTFRRNGGWEDGSYWTSKDGWGGAGVKEDVRPEQTRSYRGRIIEAFALVNAV